MKKLLCALLALVLALSGVCFAKTATLSFSASNDISELKALDGKKVTIVGYMATLSPISGKYMYLMNMPYQSCPFCVPNTQQLANTIAVYAKKNKTFDYTEQAVRVTGTLKVEDYQDDYGYTYNYRIIDAKYEIVDTSSLSPEYRLWNTIAADGVVNDIYSMFDYLHFVCQWADYTLSISDENGNVQSVYMYSGDAMNYLANDGAYGYAYEASDAYFPDLVARVRAISDTELNDLIDIINRAADVSAYALTCLYDGSTYEYDSVNDCYIMHNHDEMYEMWYEVYCAFAGDWMSKWQM